jgi:hypothetical protein
VRLHLKALIDECGYPEEILEDISIEDLSVCFNNAVWDITNGTILKMGFNKRVYHAVKAFKEVE